MKNTKKFYVLFFCLILILSVLSISNMLERKEGRERYGRFYEIDTPIDVLFFGSSHCFCSFSPMELWNEYGITSYNLGTPGESIPFTYWNIKNALNTSVPKVVVVEVSMGGKYDLYDGIAENQLMIINEIPFSFDKIKLIKTLYKNASIYSKLEAFFSIAKYHNRWKYLGKEDFLQNEWTTNGCAAYMEEALFHAQSVTERPDSDGYSNKSHDINEEYLNMIIELCKNNNIELLLTFAPIATDYKGPDLVSYLGDNVKYFNYSDDLSFLNYATDFYDEGHLNVSGCQKASLLMGKYLTKTYTLTNHKDDLDYSIWNTYYEQYAQTKMVFFEGTWDIDRLFLAMSDSNYRYEIYIDEDVVNSFDEKRKSIYDNINFDYIFTSMSEAISHDQRYNLTGQMYSTKPYIIIIIKDRHGTPLGIKQFYEIDSGSDMYYIKL